MGIEPTSHKVKVRDIMMRYVDWGGSGPPLLCVHGLSAHCRWWDSFGEALHDRYRVLALDLRGRGDSDKPNTGYGYDAHIQDLDALYMSWPSLEAYLDYWRPAVFFKDWNRYIETELRQDVKQNADGTIGRKASKIAAEYDLAEPNQVDLRACYPRIACPTLVLKAQYGVLTETDWILPPEAAQEMAKSIAVCKLVEVKGANHYTILLSKNERLQDEVRRFLKQG